jgi:hypothetical protein
MYRNEWDAAVARANALEVELRQSQSGQNVDAATIANLTQQLHAAHAELARLRGYNPQPMYAPSMFVQPARGTTILTLGILSLVMCGMILGPIAWSMGNEELRRIDRGETDPSTRGNVQAGRVCGMVATILTIAIIGFVVFVLVAAAGSASRI